MFYFAKIFERNIVKKEEKIPKKQLRKKKSRKIKTDKAKYTRSLTLLEQRPREKLQGHPSFSLIYKPPFNPSQIFSLLHSQILQWKTITRKNPKTLSFSPPPGCRFYPSGE
jgi:hypothetical protein